MRLRTAFVVTALAVFCTLTLSACQSDQCSVSTPASTTMPVVSTRDAVDQPPTPGSTPTPIGNDQLTSRTHYVLSVDFDYARHHLVVSQTVHYINSVSAPLDQLYFIVEPNRQPGVFRLKQMTWADSNLIENYALDAASLRVPLRQPLAPGEAIDLALYFDLDLPDQPGWFGYTERQTNLGDWYPFIPPYRVDHGWLVHEPSAVGEHLVYDVADYRVDLNLIGANQQVIVAASAPVEVVDRRQHYQLNAARSFAWSASAEFRVISQSVESTRVIGYVFPEHRAAGDAALQATASAVQLYSKLFAPYPHTQLSVVEADFADGMEYDGLYWLGQEYFAAYKGNPQGYLTAIAVHETAHQWWYGLVGNDQALEPWLDESLATYSELLFYENAYPELIDWWWQFRVKRFQPSGAVNSTIYDHSAFRPYVNAVYLRGAMFLDDLRLRVGDEAFLVFVRDYAARYAGQIAGANDFFAMLAEHSAVDVNDVKLAYFWPKDSP